ncbi:FAD-binding oxidoreductase [Nonomuraea jabiensis]|uniref:FAD-binding oxidoreductase n=1 Tax=Nonomuraea jabiensis TaxID=882448 RepID=UPI003433BC34
MTSHETGLRRAVRGQVLVPGDDGFDAARLAWNRAVEQKVSAVVRVEDAADAAAVVSYAKLAGLGVAVQPGGHGAGDGLDGQILVRTGRMRGVDIRPGERVARVEAGVQWGELLAAAAEHGLTGLAGSSPVVSVTGYTLGGGISWFGRSYGLAANGVRAFEVVDADGARARVTAASDPELFWALRGGGGDFALVTAMEIGLFPAPHLYGGAVIWPVARAEEVLAAFREITATAPEELTLWFTLMRFPPLRELPEPLRGLSAVAVHAAYLGEEAAGRALLAPLGRAGTPLLDTRGPLPAHALGAIAAEPTEPKAGLLRAELVTDLDDACAAALLGTAADGSVAPLTAVQVRHLGGALSRPVLNGGACGHLAEPYALSMLGAADTPQLAAAVKERQAALSKAMIPHTSGRKPYTLLGHGEKAAAAFPGDVLARLRDVKRRRDPYGVFRSNFPVQA